MTELLNFARGAIALDIPTLVRFRDSEDVFRRGLTILVLVALVVGLVGFLVDLIGGLIKPPAEVEMAELNQAFDAWLQLMPPEAAQAFKEQFLGSLKAGMEIGQRIAALPTRFPKGLTIFFEALAHWVHRPLAMLGGLLGYGIWVMLAAKLLGGNGRLQEFLGTAALSSVPYLLLVLEKVPCLGDILSIVAWLWGAVIWVAATAVTHGWAEPVTGAKGAAARYEVNWGKAILAVILPAVAFAVLILIVATLLFVLLAAAFRGARG